MSSRTALYAAASSQSPRPAPTGAADARQPTAADRAEAAYRTSVCHRILPAQQAQAALAVIEAALTRLDHALPSERPGIARTAWDLTIHQGRVAATGLLPETDRAWLDQRLAGEAALNAAAMAYVRAAVAYLETCDDNPPYHHDNSMNGGRRQCYHFRHVARQLDGTMAFRSLLDRLRVPGRTGAPGPSVADNAYSGFDSFDWVAARLRAVDEPAANDA